ncbi:hypothetical protein KP509_27G037700 [Ceratopteris richardii]|uniref:Uncharacterized protein n=1 Tax=Ceratopteris richardii TaxID=49495 RepID=A0A8T2RI63_CERRI|nr:hypothetical protein KP509_27G037700 [Ceratopteris richardii]
MKFLIELWAALTGSSDDEGSATGEKAEASSSPRGKVIALQEALRSGRDDGIQETLELDSGWYQCCSIESSSNL